MFKNLSTENKLIAKAVAYRIILPIAIVTVVHVIVKKLEND